MKVDNIVLGVASDSHNATFMTITLGDWIEKFRTLQRVDYYFSPSVNFYKKMSCTLNRLMGIREDREHTQVFRNTFCWLGKNQ